MKKLILGMMCAAALFATTGCGEKSNEDKAEDAVEEVKDAADAGVKDAAKAVDKATE